MPQLFLHSSARIPSRIGKPAIVVALSVVVAASALTFDLSLPLGVAGGVPYVALVLIGLWAPWRHYIYVLASVATGLTVLGYYLSPEGGIFWVVLVNRALALFAIWVSAILGGLIFSARALYQVVHDTAVDGIITIDQRGHIKSFNHGAEAIFGYAAREAIGRSLSMLMRPSDAEIHDTHLAEYLRSDRSKVIGVGRKVIGVRKDGAEIFLDLAVGEARLGSGRIFTAVLRDISRRERVAAEHRKLAEAVEHTRVSVIITDSDGNIDYVNPSFTKVSGYTAAGVKGKNPRFLQSGHTPPETYRELWATIGAGGTWSGEFHNKKKNGELFWERATISPVRGPDGKITSFVAVEEDITEIRLAHREALLARQIVDSSPDFVSVVDRDYRYRRVNPTYSKSFGVAVEDIVGRHVAELHGEERFQGHLKGYLDRALAGEQVRYEAWFDLAGAGRRFMTVLYSPLHEKDCRVDSVLMLARDRTEIKVTEERLHQAQKMEVVGQLTGGVAHDFNNLLAVIQGNLELLDEDLDENSEFRDFVRPALDAAGRGTALTHQLLAFSRRQALQPVAIDVNRLLSGMTDLLRRSLGEAVEIGVVLTKSALRAMADPNQMSNAILNLAINARDSMPRGGKLTIKTGTERIAEGAAVRDGERVTPGKYVTIAVGDTGSGMTEDVKSRAFEPFFTTKDVGHGSGLGLSMVYGFAKQSGGFARIESELEKGTTVTIHLPAASAAKKMAAAKPRAKPVAPAERDRTILVVEDDAAVRRLAGRMLEGLGYTVIEAKDGPEALEVLNDVSQEFDLLFTDMVLPKAIDGTELARQAKRIRPDLRILYTSGYAQNNLIDGAVVPDGASLLGKPYRREALADAVRLVLSGKGA